MSFSNTIVSNQTDGNNVDVSFNFTFTFLEDENQIGVKVYDDSGSLAVEIVPTPPHTINESTNQVVFDSPPTDTQIVVIYRQSGTTQEVEYNDFKFPHETVERHFDRIALLVQEHDKMLETGFLKDYYNPNGNDPNGGSFSGYNMYQVINGTYTATSGDLVYLTDPSNTVTINLPAAPEEGDEVVVKEASGAIANKSVDANGSTIVGVGATYALQSIYESVRFVYSAAGWLIV